MGRFSNAEKAQEAKRELGMRRHVYPKRVADGKMQQVACDRLIRLMEEMAADYEALAAKDAPDMFNAPESPSQEERSVRQIMDDNRDDTRRFEQSRDPTYGKTPGRLILSGAKWGTCRCGDKILTGLVRDALDSTLNTRVWDATPTTHDGQNYYTKHRCG